MSPTHLNYFSTLGVSPNFIWSLKRYSYFVNFNSILFMVIDIEIQTISFNGLNLWVFAFEMRWASKLVNCFCVVKQPSQFFFGNCRISYIWHLAISMIFFLFTWNIKLSFHIRMLLLAQFFVRLLDTNSSLKCSLKNDRKMQLSNVTGHLQNKQKLAFL